MMGEFIRWLLLIAFFFITEELAKKYENWKRRGFRAICIALLLILFNISFEPLSFILDYFIIWLLLSIGIKVESP